MSTAVLSPVSEVQPFLSQEALAKLASGMKVTRPTADCLTDEVVNTGLQLFGFGRPAIGFRNQRVFVHSQNLEGELRRHAQWLAEGGKGTYAFLDRPVCAANSLYAVEQVMNASCLEEQTALERIAFPIFGAHWSLLVADCQSRTLRLYDSIRGAHDRLALQIRALLRAAGLILSDWSIKRARCAKQNGVWECGYSVIACAAYELDRPLPLRMPGNMVAASRTGIASLAGELTARAKAARDSADYFESRLQNYLRFDLPYE